MRKINSLFVVVISLLIFISCKKSPVGNDSLSINGTYKGGTLHWNNANGNSGSDPNFTFHVTSLDNSSIKLQINTRAPIFSKAFTLPMTDKIETGNTGLYTFSTSEDKDTYSESLIISIIANTGYAQIDYFKLSTNSQDENFDGTGFLQ